MTNGSSDDTVGADPRTADRIAFLNENAGSVTVSVDDGQETYQATDVDLTFSDTLSDSAAEATGAFEAGDQEISFSFDVELDLEQTVVCRNCGEVNAVPDATFLTFLDEDLPCHDCGMPLGVIR